MSQSPTKPFLWGSIVLAVVVLALADAGYRLTQMKAEAENSVVHTYAVKSQLAEIVSLTKDIVTNSRGFLLTGDVDFLQNLEETRDSIEPALAKLQQLTADNARQQERVNSLIPMVRKRLQIARKNIVIRQQQGIEAARAAVSAGEGKQATEAILQTIEQMKEQEEQLLQQRLGEFRSRDGLMTTALWVLLGVLILVLLAAGHLLYRHFDAQRREAALRETVHAQAMAQLESRVSERTAELKHTTDELRLVDFSMNNASIGMAWVAEDGCILRANPAYCRMVGSVEAQAVGSTFPFAGSDLTAESWPRQWQRLRRDRKLHFETVFDHSQGHPVAVQLDLKLLEFEGREYAFAFLQDISEQKRLEEYHRFFEISPDYMCIAGFDGYFKALNSAWEKNLGFTLEELKQQPYADFVHPEDIAPTRDVATQLHSRSTSISSFRNRYKTKNGDYRWLQWSAVPVPEQQLVYAVAVDATESHRAEEERAQLNRSLQDKNAALQASIQDMEAFTYSVSHDLRAPLRHVDGFSKVLEDEFSTQLPEQARHYVRRIRSGARQMGQLVDDLLNLSRIGRKPLDLQLTRLNSLVDDALRDLATTHSDRAIEWRVRELPFVECDPSLMRQVFANLLSNAAKYTRPRNPAVVEVGSRQTPEGPIVFVRDNGVGFSMKYADKLFGIFQRLHRQEDFEGTGVGLATVQRIITRHGGRVWAEAELDKGATFFFSMGFMQGREASLAGVTGGAHE